MEGSLRRWRQSSQFIDTMYINFLNIETAIIEYYENVT